MRPIRFVAVLLASLSVTACLDSTTVVKLKPDGSGTVEQTTLVNLAALKSMMPGAEKQATAGLVNKADLERTAQRMGKGVRLLSAEPIKGENGFEGSKAIFAFDDINQIQVSQGPTMSGSSDSKFSSEPTANDPVKFSLTRGAGGSTLAINFVDRPGAGKTDPNASPGKPDMDLSNPMILNMVKTMFQGFKVNVGLDVLGTITKTNAEYVNGSRITLLEMDVNTLLADEKALKELISKLRPDASFSDVKPLLKDIKGIKIDGPSISVQFK